MEAWNAVHAVAIEQCERGITEVGRPIDERFREGCALEKTEGGCGVKLDVRRRHSDELATTEDTEDTETKTDPNTLFSVSLVSSVVNRC
jgi:hypothetical protein